MASNEVRKDYLLDRWVVIAKERKKRPTDFVTNDIVEKTGICPLCPHNEHMTPPAELVYLHLDGKLRKKKDKKGFRHKNWLVRVIPNLYPVFIPPAKNDKLDKEKPELSSVLGHHEVFVESPLHNEHPSTSRISQLVYVINSYLDRLDILSKKYYVKYISIFRNYGLRAGASLSHPHSQLITTPFIPTIPKEELKATKKYWNKKGKCLLCEILKKEILGPRFIWENNSFVVFAPWASINPFEFWVMPKRHTPNMSELSSIEVKDLAITMRICLGGLRTLLNDPPYNFGFHSILNNNTYDYYHWHLEVYPNLAIWAGFEKSSGMFINTISPEDAAKELKVTVQREIKDGSRL